MVSSGELSDAWRIIVPAIFYTIQIYPYDNPLCVEMKELLLPNYNNNKLIDE